MGGNNRQRKSSSFMSVFNIFKSNKHRGGGNHNAYEEEPKPGTKVWHSDEDGGNWGIADPVINMRAAVYIDQRKKRISESEIHCYAQAQQ